MRNAVITPFPLLESLIYMKPTDLLLLGTRKTRIVFTCNWLLRLTYTHHSLLSWAVHSAIIDGDCGSLLQLLGL